MTGSTDLGTMRSEHRGRPSQLFPLGVALIMVGLSCGALALVVGPTEFTAMVAPVGLLGGALVTALSLRHRRVTERLDERGFHHVGLNGVARDVRYQDIASLSLSDRSRDGRVPPMLRIALGGDDVIVLREDILPDLEDIARQLRAELRAR